MIHKKLLRDALNADECETYQRLARIGALVQNLLLSELIYEGTDLSSRFVEQRLRQVIGKNDYQTKQMLKNNLWECVFQRRTDTREPHKRNKLPADILEAVLGAVYLDTPHGATLEKRVLESDG